MSKRLLEGFVFIAWIGLFRYKHVFGNGVHAYHYFSVAAFVLRQFELHGLTKRDAVNMNPRPILHVDEWIVTMKTLCFGVELLNPISVGKLVPSNHNLWQAHHKQ